MRGCWLNYPEGAIGTEDHPEIINQKSVNFNAGETTLVTTLSISRSIDKI